MLGFYYFDYELRYDLIPFIESEYRTISNIKDTFPEAINMNRKHRAIAGLSMGGMQALNLTLGGYRCDSTLFNGAISPWKNGLDSTVEALGMLDLFAFVGAFSNAPTSSSGKQLGEGIVSSGYNLSLLYLTCGDADEIAYLAGYDKATDQLLETAGDNIKRFYRVIIRDGLHDFNVWNNGAYNFIRLAFGKEEEDTDRYVSVILMD
jgi:S-formylglutathione hydrolase FrmB